MKLSYLLPVLSVSILVGCSHVHDSKRDPAGATDVGVVGAGGDRLLYYQEGNFVVIQSCPANSILGKTNAEARKVCNGEANRVPVNVFKDEVRAMIYDPANKDLVKPITPQEIEAAKLPALSSEQLKSLKEEQARLLASKNTYGNEHYDAAKKAQVDKDIANEDARTKAVAKINAEVERVMTLISQQDSQAKPASAGKPAQPAKPGLTIALSSSNDLLFNVLKKFDPKKIRPCGLTGSVEDRIKDCSYRSDSVREGFQLVSITKNLRLVFREKSTNKLWSDIAPVDPSYFYHENAKTLCENMMNTQLGEGAISSLSWRLPTATEFQEAERSSIRKIGLPFHRDYTWTSIDSNNLGETVLFNRRDGTMSKRLRNMGENWQYSLHGVICIAEYK